MRRRPCRCRAENEVSERISRGRARPLDRLGPRAEARPEVRRPFVCGLEHDAAPLTVHGHLALVLWETALLGQPHGLAAAILEQLGTRRSHAKSLYAGRDIGKQLL